MIDWMISEKYPEGGWRGRGQHSFRVTPRKGDMITIDDDYGKSQIYEVLAVIHPIDPEPMAGDIIIQHIGPETDWKNTL